MKRSHLLVALVVLTLSLLVPVVVQTDYVLQILFRITCSQPWGWRGTW